MPQKVYKIITLAFFLLPIVLLNNLFANIDEESSMKQKEKHNRIYAGQHTADKNFLVSFEKTLVPKQKILLGKGVLEFEKKESNKIFGIKFTSGNKTTMAAKGAYLITTNAFILCLDDGKRIESGPKPDNLYVLRFEELFMEFPYKK
jgi:hypothetical protein